MKNLLVKKTNYLILFCIIEAQKTEQAEKEEINEGSQYSSHVSKEKESNTTSTSAFSRSKTMKEQREYLPVFAVREELLKVIRDNQSNTFFL